MSTDTTREDKRINTSPGPITARRSYWAGGVGSALTDLSFNGYYPREIYVGNAGNLKVTYVDGTEETITGIIAGYTFHDCCWASIAATGSTAYNLSFGY